MILLFAAEVILLALLSFVLGLWWAAGRQREEDWYRYGIRSSRRQIMLEILMIRKVR
jgi:hypothetical protein